MIRIGRPLYSKPDPSRPLFILTAAVDILLLIDIASDLVRKYRERKAEKNNIVSPETEEEPVVEEA